MRKRKGSKHVVIKFVDRDVLCPFQPPKDVFRRFLKSVIPIMTYSFASLTPNFKTISGIVAK